MARQHFLVAAFPGQGHINPARALAARLARANGTRVTLSAAVSAHRLMFPSLAAPDDEVHDGAISYVPYSDGYDGGFSLFSGDSGGDGAWEHVRTFERVGRETLTAVLDRLAARGDPVTLVVYAIGMYWAAEVARERGVASVLYWIQPATILAVYYHYLHGYEELVTEHAAEPEFTVAMPGLPPMAIRDLPSFFTNKTDSTLAALFSGIRRTVQQLDIDRSSSKAGAKPMVLVNTVEALEASVIASLLPELVILPVGPAVVSLVSGDGGVPVAARDLYKCDDKDYMEWLDAKPPRSVVYVSFGSMSVLGKRQKEEMRRGLAASGRPYLWVVRTDSRDSGDGGEVAGDEQAGMVVEWCDQVRVLSHPSVGCFVTHCGWNSTLESVVCGTPVVAVPQWSDQDTNARLVAEWGVGVRAIVAADRVLEAEELIRSLDMVIGDSEKAAAIRASSAARKAKLQEALAEGGSLHENLNRFLDKIAHDPA